MEEVYHARDVPALEDQIQARLLAERVEVWAERADSAQGQFLEAWA